MYGGEVEVYVLSGTSVLPLESGLNVTSSEFSCLGSIGTKDLLVDWGKFIPLVVKPLGVKRVAGTLSWDIGANEGVIDALPLLGLFLFSLGLILGAGIRIRGGPGSW